MAVFWLLSFFNKNSFAKNIIAVKQNKALHFLGLIFLIYLLGFTYTQDFQEGFKELHSKHYLITIPLMMATISFSKTQIRFAFLGFALANLFVAILVILILKFDLSLFHGSVEDASPFVQRPRASLFLCFSVFIVLEYLIAFWNKLKSIYKPIAIVGILILITALILLEGRIGLLSFAILLPIFLFFYFKKVKNKLLLNGSVSMACMAFTLVLFMNFNTIKEPFKEGFREIKESQHGFLNSDPNCSSMGMRIAYYKTYFKLFDKNPVLGVGTGDLVSFAKPSFQNHEYKIKFDKPHNQFLELGIKFGFLGLLFFLTCWYYLFQNLGSELKNLSILFTILLALSMFFDSTLGTQAGLSFFVVFYALFAKKDLISNSFQSF